MKITAITRNVQERAIKNRIYFFANKGPVDAKTFKVLIPEVLTAVGMQAVAADVKFSRVAGCKCGCSPGFIVSGSFGTNVFVDVEL